MSSTGLTSCVTKTAIGGRVRIELAIDAESEHALWAGITLDVEKGGVFVATHHVLSLGTIVELELSLPDGQPPMHIQGVVRWTRLHSSESDGAPGVGVKFIELDAREQERIAWFATTVREPIVFELDEAPPRRRRPAA